MNGERRGAESVADRLLRDLAPVDPTAAAAICQEPDSIMPRLVPEDLSARRVAKERALRAMDAAESGLGELLSIALTERLASEIALDECGFTRSLLAPLATPLHQVWEVFDELPRRATDDWQRIATHLQMMPDALVAYARTLRESAADEHVVTRRQVLGVASHRWDIAGLEAAASAATGATAQFAAFLREELSPVARQHDGVGRDRYVVTARAFLGDDVDLDETYAFGWDELTRLTARWGRWPVSLEPPPSRRPRRRWTLIRGRG